MKYILVFLFPLLLFIPQTSQAQTSTVGRSGFIKTLRVNEVDILYGPPSDNIKAEVIVRLVGDNNAYGFQLRKDDNEISHQGMLNMLRDAFVNNIKVSLTCQIKNGSTKGRIIVVQMTK